MIYLDLLLGFLKVGLFSFGGGYVAIPLIRDMVQSYGWISEDELAYMIAVSESTPGPIMINLATYVGSTTAGLIGAVIATFVVTLPAFFIILLVMTLMKNFLNNPLVQAILKGMEPCIIGIIASTGLFMILSDFGLFAESGIFDIKRMMISIFLAALMFLSKPVVKKQMSPIFLIIIGAVCGMLVL